METKRSNHRKGDETPSRAVSRYFAERRCGGTERMSTNPPKDVVEVASHDLFGCPFCGGTPELVHSDIEIKAGVKAAVECTNPECRTYGPDGHTAEEAARKWNLRTDLFAMEGAKAAVNTLVRENERLRDLRAKCENDANIEALKVALLRQDFDTIRSIITKGGTAADILKFLDTPNA